MREINKGIHIAGRADHRMFFLEGGWRLYTDPKWNIWFGFI